jgi:arylsulfatase A-like enzyme
MFSRTFFGRVFKTTILPRLGYLDIPARRHAPDINKSVLNWVDNQPDKPFFVFINYLDPHDPYLPPEPYRSLYSGDGDKGGKLNADHHELGENLTPEQIQGEIDAYDGSIKYLDEHIGSLLSEFEKNGIGDNLLVIVTSDHGESFKEHDVFMHGNSLYREEIHVPLIISWKGNIPEQKRIDFPVSNAAIPSTLVDLLNADQPSPFPSASLVNAWQDGAEFLENPLPLAEMSEQYWKPAAAPISSGWLRTLVGPTYQYLEYEVNDEELFNWVIDPLEQHNLLGNIELQEVIQSFRSSLKLILSEMGGSVTD